MSASAVKRVKAECERFCRVKGLKGMEDTLYRLAIRSYYAMSSKERATWSLKQVVDQGLLNTLPLSPQQ